jgi:hypothetical protein
MAYRIRAVTRNNATPTNNERYSGSTGCARPGSSNDRCPIAHPRSLLTRGRMRWSPRRHTQARRIPRRRGYPCRFQETIVLEIDLIEFFQPPFGRRRDGIGSYYYLLNQVGVWRPNTRQRCVKTRGSRRATSENLICIALEHPAEFAKIRPFPSRWGSRWGSVSTLSVTPSPS